MLLVAVLACVLAVTAAPAVAKSKLKLTSPAFPRGGTIPEVYTCDGSSASLPLQWKGVPKKAVELALTMDDPDAVSGTFVHWVVWGIDPDLRQLPTGQVPDGVSQGANGAGSNTYIGPCPPSGVHRYRLTLYALSKPVDLTGEATIDDLREAIKGTVVAKAKLVGRYSRS